MIDFGGLEKVWQASLDEFYVEGSSSFMFEAISRDKATGGIASNEIWVALLNHDDFRLVRAFLTVCSHVDGRQWLVDRMLEVQKHMKDSTESD